MRSKGRTEKSLYGRMRQERRVGKTMEKEYI
nr:MAG TPA: hypothetical protein [Caudoviricetes sp.]